MIVLSINIIIYKRYINFINNLNNVKYYIKQ